MGKVIGGWMLGAVVAVLLGGCTIQMPSEGQVNKQMRAGTGFVKKEAVFEGRERVYWVFLPNDYTPARKWPAILFLHGWAQGGRGGAAASNSGLGAWLVPHAKTFPFIAVFPQSHDGWWTDTVDQDDAIGALGLAEGEFQIDKDRVALMGISTGGRGAWITAARYPNQFACLVSMAAKAEVGLAPKIARMPVWVLHYSTDPVIGEQNSEVMIEALRKAGGSPRFTKVPGFGHYVWEDGCSDELFAWMASQRRGAAMAGMK